MSERSEARERALNDLLGLVEQYAGGDDQARPRLEKRAREAVMEFRAITGGTEENRVWVDDAVTKLRDEVERAPIPSGRSEGRWTDAAGFASTALRNALSRRKRNPKES
jgi:hypothetical protein